MVTLCLHRNFYFPYHPTPEAIPQRHVKEGKVCAYNECDWDYYRRDGDDSDTDSAAGYFHIGPPDEVAHEDH